MAGSPAVSLSLTSEQAALLLLVLQQVTNHHTSKGATQNATDIDPFGAHSAKSRTFDIVVLWLLPSKTKLAHKLLLILVVC